MVEKVTKMLIKVDLQCSRCYKKIKKILCKYPHIRDQTYDEKKNEVLITVVCCSPEKIRDKIICKGDEMVQSVEILPDKPEPKQPEKKLAKPKEAEKPKEPEDLPPPRPQPPPPVQQPMPPPDARAKEPENPKVVIVKSPKEPSKLPALASAPPPQKVPEPVAGYPPVPMIPMVGVCCCPCYEGYGGRPCYYHGQERPAMCYDGCGRPAYECQGGSRGYYVSRCDYFSEENPTGCTVM